MITVYLYDKRSAETRLMVKKWYMLYSSDNGFRKKTGIKLSGKSPRCSFVRGYLHQGLVSSKTENQIGFSISG